MDDRYAINAAKTEIREGYNTADAERILAVHAERYLDLSHGLPSFGGAESKAVLRERLKALFSRYDVGFVPVIMDIHLFGTTALDYGWHELRLRPRTGEPETLLRTRYIELWRKEDQGLWRITLFLDNADQQPILLPGMIQAIRAGEFDTATRGST